MMYFLQFKIGNKSYLLHDGETFVGSDSQRGIEILAFANMAKGISVDGFEIVQVNNTFALSRMVGGVPYRIIDMSGGFHLPFHCVEIVVSPMEKTDD